MNPRVLIIDDEKTFRMVVQAALAAEGYEVFDAPSGRLGLARYAETSPDVVILDWNLPDIDGLKLLEKMKAQSTGPDRPVVIMATAYAEVESAVKALKAGAHDYLTKPLQLPELLVTVQKALDARKLRKTVRTLQGQAERNLVGDSQLGGSPAMVRLLEMVDKVAAAPETTVLVEGESGTGKEVIARLLHHRTLARKGGPFIELNCAGLPETLMESELFGHVKGAFTDARVDKEGLLEVADGGTLFLDEIGEMPLALQAKLLRVLETSTFRRLGGVRDLTVNLRFIAATNRDLAAEVEQGRFRLDLYHRLDVFRLHLPPLRDRREDVLPLANAFLQELARKLGKSITAFSPEAEGLLKGYSFPGNVRELRNTIERAVILESSDRITREVVILGRDPGGSGKVWDLPAEALRRGAEPPTLDELEREYIAALLDYTGGNRTQVARLMGVSYPTVMKKITDYGIDLSVWVKPRG